MVVAFIALFVAIGRQLVRRHAAAGEERRLQADPQGRGPDGASRQNAVTGAKIKDASLTGADIKLAVAGRRVDARRARPTPVRRAVSTRSRTSTQPASGVPARAAAGRGGNQPTVVAGALGDLPARDVRLGGGVGVDDNTNTSVVDSFPQPGGHAWIARVDNNDPGAAHGFTVVAVCVPAVAAG